MKKTKYLIGFSLSCLLTFSLFTSPVVAQNVPLVYGVENTGFHLKKPKMVAPEKLPVIRELPNALEGVKKFSDWTKRRNTISHMIQHYGIGEKPVVASEQVKARLCVPRRHLVWVLMFRIFTKYIIMRLRDACLTMFRK